MSEKETDLAFVERMNKTFLNELDVDDHSRLRALARDGAKLKQFFSDPPRHKFWGAGEPDCPRDIRAPNGELHSLRCKVCGETNPKLEFCKGA